MLIRYQDLVSLRLVATDGSEHAIEDVFVTDKDQRVTYVVADIGGWFDDRKAMVSIERFGEPDVAAARWPCSLDEAALEERPALAIRCRARAEDPARCHARPARHAGVAPSALRFRRETT
jgi:hypothetical protein